jgi:hypothetical protein
MSRALESRVGKLEQKNGFHDEDQIFVMWCRPDEDEDKVFLAAANEGLFVLDEKRSWPGGRATCCHWKGEDPMPEPRWVTIEQMTDDELTYMLDSLKARTLRNGEMTEEQWDEMDPEVQRRKDPEYIAAQKRNEEMCARFRRPRALQ